MTFCGFNTTFWLRLKEDDWANYLLGLQRRKGLIDLIQAVLEGGERLGLYGAGGHQRDSRRVAIWTGSDSQKINLIECQ